MSEPMLILSGNDRRSWPAIPSSDDPETIMLRLLACLRDLDRIDARLAAVYLETAILQLRAQYNLDRDGSETD